MEFYFMAKNRVQSVLKAHPTVKNFAGWPNPSHHSVVSHPTPARTPTPSPPLLTGSPFESSSAAWQSSWDTAQRGAKQERLKPALSVLRRLPGHRFPGVCWLAKGSLSLLGDRQVLRPLREGLKNIHLKQQPLKQKVLLGHNRRWRRLCIRKGNDCANLRVSTFFEVLKACKSGSTSRYIRT